MNYHSTRSALAPVTSARAVLEGLAPDGGLYMPEHIPTLDWQKVLEGSSLDMSAAILSALLPDIPNMEQLVKNAYIGQFETEDLTPTVSVGDYTVLELFRGPTSAFKDVALRMLPQLLTSAKDVCGVKEDIMILTATSGDTGKAALAGFRDVPGIRITVFYPYGGVSKVQRAQMVTQEGENVTVCAVRGNFDDAQTGVKNIFTACQGKELPFRLSSANSINIGRLAPQVMYYFKAYKDLLESGKIKLGDEVNFSVPTGNFGDILAGYLAKQMGLPVGMLICASNSNDVLTEFLNTGRYNRIRLFCKTLSPSMDILVSSNLERLLYLMSGCDCDLVAELMGKLNTDGRYHVPDYLFARIRHEFRGYSCGDLAGQIAIGHVWKEHGYLMDTHTAAGWVAAEKYTRETGDKRPMVVLSTASPYKFPAAVLAAVTSAGASPEQLVSLLKTPEGDEFDHMEQLEAITGVKIPGNLSGLKEKPERHTGVIDKEEMLNFVLEL